LKIGGSLEEPCLRHVSSLRPLLFVQAKSTFTMVAFNSVIAAATVGAACAFAPASSMMGTQLRTTATARSAVPQMGLEQYKKELAETAKKIASPGEFRSSLFAQKLAIELCCFTSCTRSSACNTPPVPAPICMIQRWPCCCRNEAQCSAQRKRELETCVRRWKANATHTHASALQ
jgi:hypothetical protein